VGHDPPINVVVAPSKSERRRVKRPLPGWLSVAVVAACLIGGAWLLWWFVAGGGPRERTVTLKEVPRQARRGGGGPNPVGNAFRQLTRAATGVFVVKGDEWHVRSPGDTVMRVIKRPDGRFESNFYFDRNDLVSPDELSLLVFRAEVANNEAAARAAGVTTRQMESFKKLQSQTGMAISTAERNELAEMWETYVASPDAPLKGAAERTMVERLEAVGRTNLEATKRQMSARALVVKSLLTPEQLQHVQQRRR
jgi:hypothetical protein